MIPPPRARPGAPDIPAAPEPPGHPTAEPVPATEPRPAGNDALPVRVRPAALPLLDLVARAGAAVVAERRRRAIEQGTSATALAVLRALGDADVPGQRELAARAGIAPATLTPVLDALAADGHVVRARDREDRRVQRVAITGRGRERVRAAAERDARADRPPDPPAGHAEAVREYLLAVIARLEQDHPGADGG